MYPGNELFGVVRDHGTAHCGSSIVHRNLKAFGERALDEITGHAVILSALAFSGSIVASAST